MLLGEYFYKECSRSSVEVITESFIIFSVCGLAFSAFVVFSQLLFHFINTAACARPVFPGKQEVNLRTSLAAFE